MRTHYMTNFRPLMAVCDRPTVLRDPLYRAPERTDCVKLLLAAADPNFVAPRGRETAPYYAETSGLLRLR